MEICEPRLQFETFKGNVCHMVKNQGDLPFIVEILKKDDISRLWEKQWYPEAFYLLAMVDYLSRIDGIPLCSRYDRIREQKLEKVIYPRDVDLAWRLSPDLDVREQSRKESIPEFIRFNIVETDIRNVC